LLLNKLLNKAAAMQRLAQNGANFSPWSRYKKVIFQGVGKSNGDVRITRIVPSDRGGGRKDTAMKDEQEPGREEERRR